ncbi:hypothetical protein [Nocardia sp. CNY236]|uniref:hypothetical protein n=1 Tax=Nocardia sp. CNY236 TaxID=1169152 RepID=UPI00042203B8|nr:hypothetical protein [Nocardia sp. CNY236]
MRICFIAAALIALPVFTACGSDTAEPDVTRADIVESLQGKGLDNPELADCAAGIFLDLEISQAGLRVMISDEYDETTPDQETLGMSEEDADKVRGASGRIASECFSVEPPG